MIRVGLIGAGFMGEMHATVYTALPETQVVGIVDLNAAKAEKLAAKTGARAYAGFDELLAHEDCEVIDICLPTHLHREYTLRAARAGKDIFCEKPMALTEADAEAMTAACRAAGVKFTVGQCIRFWPEYQMLTQYITGGTFGHPRVARFARLSPRPTWSQDGWLHDPALSGSAALDLHIHDTDYLVSVFGEPQEVCSVGARTAEGWQHIETQYRYPALTVTAAGGWDYPETFPFSMSFQVVFEKAVVDFISTRTPGIIIYEPGKEPWAPEPPQAPSISAGESSGNISSLGGYYNELRYFIDCVRDDIQPAVVTPESACRSLAVALAEIRSLDTGRPVRLSPVSAAADQSLG